ncbi:MAG TPA: SMC-Scp complex subunit ScpB [Candidatus Paceibacterota bacterium]
MSSEATGNLAKILEAVLFWKGEPASTKELAKLVKADEAAVTAALANLKESLSERGVVLLEKNSEYSLATCAEASALIEEVTKEELSKDLGKASLETLSIILYKGPVKRSEIDYVRGVNSNFILRNLLVRGLIEKKQSPDDARASVYQPSFELLSYIGVQSVESLPNFELVQEELRQFRANAEKESEKQADMPSAGETDSDPAGQPPSVEETAGMDDAAADEVTSS